MVNSPRCPSCQQFVYLDKLVCPNCGIDIAYHVPSRQFAQIVDRRTVIDGETWYACSNRTLQCNWLVHESAPNGQCLSCRLTREQPDRTDPFGLDKLAMAEEPKRRLVLQLMDLGLPILPWYAAEGGLGFDLFSSITQGSPVIIGHVGGIITIDLAESLDDHREALRVQLGEPYRTMLGHLRHEVGHYYQNVLVTDDADWAECRDLFGDERASYQDALDRHYSKGAPPDWSESYISEYATMHPWEDFAETFAHYLHITGTLQTAAATGMIMAASDGEILGRDTDVVPLFSYQMEPIRRLITDWLWLSQAFNRINHSMGLADLYPFELPVPVQRKLEFIHKLVTRAPITMAEQQALSRIPHQLEG